MAIDLAIREAVCPVQGGIAGIGMEDEIVFPMSKSAVVQFLPGAAELTLFHGDKEISFESEGQIAFATRLARQGRFRAGDALEWTSLDWPEIATMIQDLVDSGVLIRAVDFDGSEAIEREDLPSPLPPAPAQAPRSWREEGLIAELTGCELERGYLEVVVPIFRIAHPFLDRDGRQVGEGNVFPKALRVEVATQWRSCTYGGTRYQPHRPMNMTAMKAMRAHWPQMMIMLRELRSAYLHHFPAAADAWTLGHVERLSVTVLALPSYLLMLEHGAVANRDLHPVLSNLFRVTDGLRMAVHQMMFLPGAEAMLTAEAPTSAAEIFAYAERNYSFHSEHGVCAGPQFMIEEFLSVLLDGQAPKSGWLDGADPELAPALQAIEPAMDYGLLGLGTHAATFSLWPAMARAYEQIAAALDGAGSLAAAGFAAHREKMSRHSYLGSEAWRQHRESVYAQMGSGAAAAFGGAGAEMLPARHLATPMEAETARTLAPLLRDRLGEGAAGAVGETVAAFLARGQAILRVVESRQRRINALLGRPFPRRRLKLSDLDIHNKLITGQDRALPFLLGELHDLLGLTVDADASGISIARSADRPFDGDQPIDATRAPSALLQGD